MLPNLSSSSLSTMGNSYVGAAYTQPGTLIARGQAVAEPVILLGKLIRWLETKALVQDSAADELFEPSVTSKYTKEIEVLHKQIEKDGDVGTLSGLNPVVVGEVFRLCLLEIEPLTTEEMYDAFMLTRMILNYPDKVKYLRSVLIVLPKYSQILLRQTINLLQNLVDFRQNKLNNADKNDPSSIISTANVSPLRKVSEMFGPLLLRPKELVYYMSGDESICQEVVEILIREHESLMKAIDVEGPSFIIGAV